MSYQTRFRKLKKNAKSSDCFYPDALKKLKKSKSRRPNKLQPAPRKQEEPGPSDAVRSSLFEKFQIAPEETKECVDVDEFVEDLLSDVKEKLNKLPQETPKKKPTRKYRKNKPTFIDRLPKFGDKKSFDIKKIAENYLNSFLDILYVSDDEKEESSIFQGPVIEPEYFHNPLIKREAKKCSFNDTLCSEGYFSSPMEGVKVNCPWPSIDRCPLTSQVERKNGNIFVVKQEKRYQYEEMASRGKSGKRKRTVTYTQPPRYITPIDYHRRSLEHLDHLERCQWRNIVYSQEYEQVYRSTPPWSIPGYVMERPFRSANWYLIQHLETRCASLSPKHWEAVKRIAASGKGEIPDLPAALIEHFFYRRIMSTSEANRRKKHNKRLIQTIKPELYLVPQLVTRHLVPKLPDLPPRPSTSATKTPELRNFCKPPCDHIYPIVLLLSSPLPGGRTLVLTDSLSKFKADSISKNGLFIYS
eukprot:sb/3464388/